MTKKDYIEIAEMLKDIKKGSGKNGLTSNQKLTFDAIVYRLGSIFINDNGNFDRDKFSSAVYD